MKKYLLLFLLGCAATVSRGYESQYKWTVLTNGYSYVNGAVDMNMNLGSAAVNAMVEDKNGNIWLAVAGKGLLMFDGKKLLEPKMPKESFARTSDVLSLAVDSKNTLYAGTKDGLVMYDGSDWVNIEPASTGMAAITGIAITATDKVYVTGQIPGGEKMKEMRGSGLAFFNGQGWTSFTVASTPGMPDDSLEQLTIDGSNHLWALPAGGGNGVAKFDGKNWKLFNTSTTSLPTNDVRAIATNSSGTVWLATTKGIVTYKDGVWESLAYTNGFNSKKLALMTAGTGDLDVTSLAVEEDGTMWIGTRNAGVISIRGNSVKVFNQETSLLPQNAVMKTVIGKDRRKWFLTGARNAGWGAQVLHKGNDRTPFAYGGGVVALQESDKVYDPKWTIIDNTSSDLLLSAPLSIAEAGDGAVWMPNASDGLVKYGKDGSTTIYRHPNGEFASAFGKMYVAPDGKIYLNTAISGIKVYENGTITDFAKWPNMGGVMDMTYDKDGVLWSAGTGGLSKRVGDDWETYNKKNGDLPSIIIYSVFRDSKGTLWAGTAKGLVKYDGSTFQTFGKKEYGFPSDDITVIAESKDGRLWLGTKSGISIFDGTNWTHISKVESPKLSKFTVNGISFDKAGNAWIATDNDGLLRFDGTTWTQWNRENTGILFDKVVSVMAGSDGKVYAATEFYQFNDTDFALPNQSPSQATEQMLRKKVKDADPKRVFAIFQP